MFEGHEMSEITLDKTLIALDGLIIAEKHNMMIILCDKRTGDEVL